LNLLVGKSVTAGELVVVMKETEAYFSLLAEERQRIVDVPSVEHRQWTDDELKRMALIDQALTAIVNDDRRRQPPAAPPPAPSAPGSDYRLVAERVYDNLREAQKQASTMVADYGRWLVATISASHLGGIFFVGGLPAEAVPWTVKEPAIWSLVIGLVSILAAGLVTYFNWSLNARAYAQMANPELLIDPQRWPKLDEKLAANARLTMRIAIGLGVLSVVMLIVSAGVVSLGV
jgi:hypothetical protein